MQDWIDETGCTEFHELARYARNERFDDWYDVIATQSTVFLNAYIRSKRHGGDHNEYREGMTLNLFIIYLKKILN